MEKPTEEQTSKRARELWEQAGKPEGRDEEIWHQAERSFSKIRPTAHRTIFDFLECQPAAACTYSRRRTRGMLHDG